MKIDQQRRELMQRVRRRGTPAETRVAKVCRDLGLFYRLNVASLPGSPDLANKSRRWAIFVNGCFWHQHRGCPKATMPKRNAEFWRQKFAANRERDARKVRILKAHGFRVMVVWECETANLDRVRRRLSDLRESRVVQAA